MNKIIGFLNDTTKNLISNHIKFFQKDAFEIRMRINCPIIVKTLNGDYFVDFNKISQEYNDTFYKVKKSDIDETLAKLTHNSIHAFEKEIQNGYITVEGGHRIGLSGTCIYEGDSFKGFKSISTLNIRIAKEFKGCSMKYFKYFLKKNNKIYNTLIVGPPLSGKTTFIRDISTLFSDGTYSFKGCDVTIIDERGEISSLFNGIPQMNIGRRTDILAYCMKKEGFIISIRALAPKIIICDELGTKEDFEIIQYALKSGVNIIATAHGGSLEDIKKNIYLRDIIENNFFDRAVILKSSKEPSVVKEIYDIERNKVIFSDGD